DPVSRRKYFFSGEESVYFEPPLWSILAGGVIGSFLLSLFIAILQIKKHSYFKVDRKENIQFTLSLLWAGIVNFIFGIIVSSAVILLLQRTSDFNLPITLSVEDYLGGIVIGLFSSKLGETLTTTLTSNT
ncbi:hypothetical protein, partial [Fulvivirga aurantia]|uniref:hypothetical protein n=1 Tax=Fulvivirga aurantia TaxID=2529383 RepID=UPI0016258421